MDMIVATGEQAGHAEGVGVTGQVRYARPRLLRDQRTGDLILVLGFEAHHGSDPPLG